MHALMEKEERERKGYCEREEVKDRYSRSFDEALEDAVEKRVSKIEESFLVEVAEFIKKRPSLQVRTGVQIHLLILAMIDSVHKWEGRNSVLVVIATITLIKQYCVEEWGRLEDTWHVTRGL